MWKIDTGHHHECSWETRRLAGSSSLQLPTSIKRRRSDPHKVSLWRKYTTSHRPNDNFTECLDTNWTLRVLHVNLSTNILDHDIFRTVQTNLQSLWDSYTPYEAHSDASVLVWNIVLSLAVLYLYRQNRLLVAFHRPRPQISLHGI
jgi:hypothetical protein